MKKNIFGILLSVMFLPCLAAAECSQSVVQNYISSLNAWLGAKANLLAQNPGADTGPQDAQIAFYQGLIAGCSLEPPIVVLPPINDNPVIPPVDDPGPLPPPVIPGTDPTDCASMTPTQLALAIRDGLCPDPNIVPQPNPGPGPIGEVPPGDNPCPDQLVLLPSGVCGTPGDDPVVVPPVNETPGPVVPPVAEVPEGDDNDEVPPVCDPGTECDQMRVHYMQLRAQKKALRGKGHREERFALRFEMKQYKELMKQEGCWPAKHVKKCHKPHRHHARCDRNDDDRHEARKHVKKCHKPHRHHARCDRDDEARDGGGRDRRLLEELDDDRTHKKCQAKAHKKDHKGCQVFFRR